jgi:hypothetical protein
MAKLKTSNSINKNLRYVCDGKGTAETRKRFMEAIAVFTDSSVKHRELLDEVHDLREKVRSRGGVEMVTGTMREGSIGESVKCACRECEEEKVSYRAIVSKLEAEIDSLTNVLQSKVASIESLEGVVEDLRGDLVRLQHGGGTSASEVEVIVNEAVKSAIERERMEKAKVEVEKTKVEKEKEEWRVRTKEAEDAVEKWRKIYSQERDLRRGIQNKLMDLQVRIQ